MEKRKVGAGAEAEAEASSTMYEKRYGIWDGYVYGRRGTKVVVVVYVMYVFDKV